MRTAFFSITIFAIVAVSFVNGFRRNDSGIMDKIDKKSSPSMCERIHPEELPKECICDDSAGHLSLVIICVKPFNNTFLNDTLGIKLAIEPCDEYGSSLSFNITERNHHIDYRVSGIRAGEEMEFPIPGLSIAVPTLGHAGMDVAVLIAGNPDQLTLRIGLDACVVLRTHTICASSIPGLQTFLPWWILSGTYSFGDICNTTTIMTTKTTTTTTTTTTEAITSQ